jgi:parallel beta-helix repeat protein
MANVVKLNPEYFPNPDRGRPVNLGDVYVGEPDLDPEVVGNQKQLSVLQEDGSVVNVDQPISLSAGGVPEYNGSPVTLLVDGDYSLKVLNSQGSQIYYVPSDQSLLDDRTLSSYGCDLAAAVTAIGATETTLIVDCTATVASGTTVTIPATMTLEFIRGGLIQGVAGGGTKTLAYAAGSGHIADSSQQIYGDNLSVTFAADVAPTKFVEWWGTVSDSTIQLAIDSVTTSSNIEINYGTYNIANAIAYSGKTIDFNGNGSTLQLSSSVADMITVTSAGKLILRNTILDGNGNSTGKGIQVTTSGIMPELYNVTVDDMGVHGVSTENTTTGSFFAINTITKNCTSNGFRILGAAGSKSQLINCSGLDTGSIGAIIEVSDSNEVIGGHYEGNTSGGVSLRASNSAVTPGQRHRVVGVSTKDNTGAGIFIGLGAENAVVTGCTVEDTGNLGFGISIDTIDSNVGQDCYATVTGNTIVGTTRGIRVNGCKGFTLVGNTIIDPADRGIHILNGSAEGFVGGNTCIGTDAWIEVSGSTGPPDLHCEDIKFGTNFFHGVTAEDQWIKGAVDQVNVGKPVAISERTANLTLRSVPIDIVDMDTSGGNKTVEVPESSTIGNGQSITIYKSSALNNLTVQRVSADVFYNIDGTTSTSDVWTDIWSGAIYTSVTGGWTRVPLLPLVDTNTTRIVSTIYDFDVDGGAVSTINLGVTLPDNASIIRAWYETLTDPTSGGAATIAITTAEAANEIVTATAFDNAVFDPGYHDAIPDGTAANFTTKTTAARTIDFVIGGAALTAGKIRIWMEYITSE